MLRRKELTPMQRVWNAYHVSQGMSDRTKWTEHQYYDLGSKRERRIIEDDDFWNSNYQFDLKRNKRIDKKAQERENRISSRNHNFKKQVEDLMVRT